MGKVRIRVGLYINWALMSCGCSVCAEGTRMVMPVRVRFVVLDCTHLQVHLALSEFMVRSTLFSYISSQGVDATAARSCFRQLQNTASLHDIHLCYAGLNSRTLALLQAHGAISEPVSKAFPSLYAALDWWVVLLYSFTLLSKLSFLG